LPNATQEQKEYFYNLLKEAKKQLEAANPAQQAAIAINMKKKGKKPKSEVSESVDYLPEK
jgi:polyhydroxyalkanoate synthesis regulator phasin